jgi:hypothetical protein
MTSRSPERGSFRAEGIIKRAEEGETSIEHAEEMINLYKSWEQQTLELEETAEWKINNLEYDLRSTDWILKKAQSDEVYAQNLYAAMCNNEFQKLDTWPILKGETWSCSWRHAGGIISDMLEKGDYIDWYCSGIRGDALSALEFNELNLEQQLLYKKQLAYVSESTVTDEIREDLRRLGWAVVDRND